MKYFIVKADKNGNRFYKKNKTVDGWSGEGFKRYCWRFSKQGAKQICDRLNRSDYTHTYYFIPAEEVTQ